MNIVSCCIATSALIAGTAGFAQYAASNPVPRGNPGSWVDIEAAPPKLIKKLKKDKAIRIRFTLSVGPEGRATGCTHDASKKLDVEFGELTCSQVMRRARFNPAKDTQGTPVSGKYSSVATWVRPKETGLL